MPEPSRAEDLQRALKRCSVETVEAAARFEKTRSADDAILIVRGVISRELPPERVAMAGPGYGASRLMEDLGLDSISRLEVVVSLEQIFAIQLTHERLLPIKTLADLEALIRALLDGADPPSRGSSQTA